MAFWFLSPLTFISLFIHLLCYKHFSIMKFNTKDNIGIIKVIHRLSVKMTMAVMFALECETVHLWLSNTVSKSRHIKG